MDAVCRPPRDIYSEDDLIGGRRATFSFGSSGSGIRKYYREDIQLKNPRGHILMCSHYRPCVVTSKDGRLPCIIYCHTNSGSRRDAEEIAFSFLPYRCTVFALDFSGSGLSEGEWVTLGAFEVEDLGTAVQYLREEGSTSTVALWGRSMGAVTAIMYSHQDPSIAGVVADSPFSKLVDLMFELATSKDQGLRIPRPLARMAMALMRRSVKKRAGFSIDQVSPLDKVEECYVPTLFGHGKDDDFIPLHHSEKLFVSHGADTKNFVAFEGDHNSARPSYWYENALTFLLTALRVDEMLGPDVDLRSSSEDVIPHMQGGSGIYVCRPKAVSSPKTPEGDRAEEEDEFPTIQDPGSHELRAPWDRNALRMDERMRQEEEIQLQRVLELSLEESKIRNGHQTENLSWNSDENDEALEKALDASLKEYEKSNAEKLEEAGEVEKDGAFDDITRKVSATSPKSPTAYDATPSEPDIKPREV